MDWNAVWNGILNFLSIGGVTLLKVVFAFLVGYLIIRIVKIIAKKFLTRLKISTLIQKYIMNTLTFLLYVCLILLILQILGVQISAVLAAIAAAGLAVALALQDTLKSITNGIVLIVTKPFKENDFVNIDGVVGTVKSINFFTTTIVTLDNKRMIIPNKNMVSFTIENNTYYAKRRFAFRFKVDHSADITKLEEVVKNAILSNPKVFTKPTPILLCKEICENGVEFEARGWCPSEMPLFEVVEAQVLATLYNELKKNGIVLASKSIVVYNENKPAVFVDEKALPERDMNKEPEVNHKEDMSIYEYMDMVEDGQIERIRQKKIEKKQKRNSKKSAIKNNKSKVNKVKVEEDKKAE